MTLLIGDFIVTHEFVRVFLVDTKTEKYKSDQWSTFSDSPTETSTYTLLQNLIKNIITNANDQSLHNLANFPIMFKSLERSGNDSEIPKITYNEFLKKLKTACVVIGQFANGNPDKVIKYSGRWRSNAFEVYIDHTVLFELQLKSIQSPK